MPHKSILDYFNYLMERPLLCVPFLALIILIIPTWLGVFLIENNFPVLAVTFLLLYFLGIFIFISHIHKGCDLHLMSALPSSPAPYENSYILIKNGTQELYYIKPNGVYEKVNIEDFNLFEKKLNLIKKKDDTKLHLNEEQIRDIVTSNGGHTPNKTERGSISDDLRVDEFHSSYPNLTTEINHDKPTEQFHRVEIDYENFYHGLSVLLGFVTFIGSYIYCIITYGFLLGVGLGWLPSAITAIFVGFLWPIILPVLIIFFLYVSLHS